MAWPSFTRSQHLALLGGTLAVVSAVLPWLTIAGTTVPGYYHDGLIGVMAGVSIVGVVLIREWTLLEWLAVAVFGLLTLVVAGRTLVGVGGTGIGVGVAVYAQVIAGALAIAGAASATVESTDDATGDGVLGGSLRR